MAWLPRVLCAASLIWLGSSACSDDDGGDGHAGSGGSGGVDAQVPDAGGSGDSGGTGGGDGADAGARTKEQCLEIQMSTADVPTACLECTCEVQPYITAQCDADCWALLMCLGANCSGNFEDFDCVNAECSTWLEQGSLSEAVLMVVSLAVAQCVDDCAFGDDGGVGQDDGG